MQFLFSKIDADRNLKVSRVELFYSDEIGHHKTLKKSAEKNLVVLQSQ